MWANKGIIMVDEGPVSEIPDTRAAPKPALPDDARATGPWGPGYVQVNKPDDATHVYEPTIGVKERPCAHPRSLNLRWLKRAE